MAPVFQGTACSMYCTSKGSCMQTTVPDHCARPMGSSLSLLCNHLCSSSRGPAVDKTGLVERFPRVSNTSLHCYTIMSGISAAMAMF